jgi:murein DD-endopeptidase MepM/ murein hydrolase activator NlpD
MIKFFTLFFIQFLISIGFSQTLEQYPKDYFRSPLDIPLVLSGNFGELRNNHFHSGLDIKTQGVEGQKVYAIADGFISRIKISPIGYGKIIYITHPNGYTSAYAHLQQFKGELAKEVKRYQYANETFEMDYYPPDTLLKVKKGDVVALSGNSGSSGGPHLHFEIRETVSEYAVNPLLFGFDIKDDVKPVIKSISVFPLNDTSYVNNRNTTQEFGIIGSNGNYQLSNNVIITAYGQIGVGINTYDQQSGASNQNGVYSIMLFDNNELIYKSELSKFSFDHSRALNSMLDYDIYLCKKTRFQRSCVAPNNPLTIFKEQKNHGTITMVNNETRTINYMVSDINKNTALLSFNILGKKPEAISIATIKAKVDTILKYSDDNILDKHNIMVSFPKGVLYNDLHLQYQEKPALKNSLSPVYQIHNGYTPIHDFIEVSIKAGRITEEQRKKVVMVNIDQNGAISSKGGEWRNNYLTAKSKILGGFTIMLDTIAPIVNPVNIFANKNMAGNSSIVCTMSDNLSGIKTYRGEIDGKWVLMDYDGKTAKLTHVFDNLTTGNHTFKLEVTDFVDNKTVLEIPFIR